MAAPAGAVARCGANQGFAPESDCAANGRGHSGQLSPELSAYCANARGSVISFALAGSARGYVSRGRNVQCLVEVSMSLIMPNIGAFLLIAVALSAIAQALFGATSFF